jgi:hypothetical protein
MNLEQVSGIPLLEKTFGVWREVGVTLCSYCQLPDFFGVVAVEKEVVYSFFNL